METIEKHESYAQLSFNRVQGNPGPLYGSSITHRNYIMMELHESRKNRSLHRTWYSTGKLLARVEMSATQFAELITSMNTQRIPVTLRHFNGENMPPCPETNQRQLFEQEFEARMKKVMDRIEAAVEKAKEVVSAKNMKAADRYALLNHMYTIRQELTDNMPFAQSSFNEAMDKTVLEAKGEVEAFVTNKVMELGIAAFKDQVGVGLVEYSKGEEVIDADGNDGTPTD